MTASGVEWSEILQNTIVFQCCARYCTQWINYQCTLCFQRLMYHTYRYSLYHKRVIHHIRGSVHGHHSRLAKKAPSQNHPSYFNLHNFSSHTFLTGRYAHHHSKGSKQQGKNDLHHVLCVTQYNLHRFLPHVSVKRRTPNKTCTRSITPKVKTRQILTKFKATVWKG